MEIRIGVGRFELRAQVELQCEAGEGELAAKGEGLPWCSPGVLLGELRHVLELVRDELEPRAAERRIRRRVGEESRRKAEGVATVPGTSGAGARS